MQWLKLVRCHAGADMIGNEETIADIKAGKINFDKCLATANMMPKLSAVARVLGPRGLMPNPKLGTLVDSSSIPGAVKQMKAGRVEFRYHFHCVAFSYHFPCHTLFSSTGF